MARYSGDMIQSAVISSAKPVDALRDALATGDLMLRSAAPILRHLVNGAQHAFFADEIVARVRGYLFDLAGQLLGAVDTADDGPVGSNAAALDRLFGSLIDLSGLLTHLHALALEWRLTERLHSAVALDPVLPPLLQALLASEDPGTSSLAMNILAAQARFVQSQRRMQLPLGELPADLLHSALLALRTASAGKVDTTPAEERIRASYDERCSRLALIARAVTSVGSGAVAAHSLCHAGVAVFAAGLSLATGTERDVVLLSTAEEQPVRLALLMRAAGLEAAEINEQLLIVRPGSVAPGSWGGVSPKLAGTILASTVRSMDE